MDESAEAEFGQDGGDAPDVIATSGKGLAMLDPVCERVRGGVSHRPPRRTGPTCVWSVALWLGLAAFVSTAFVSTAFVSAAEVGAAGGESKFAPTSEYETRPLEGWTIRVLARFPAEEPKLFEETWTLLRYQLLQVVRVVPGEAVEKLRQIPIWVELDEPHHPCMAYHPDPGWLRAHDMNPEKGRAVELANARNFLSWTKQQPWMVLHELAHGYHHQFLEGGHDNPELEAALTRAKEDRLYDQVLHINGRTDRHYALTNQAEYFAEQTEAYFGTNDFFPFVRPELARHDPRMYALVRHLWGIEVPERAKPGS